MARLTDHIVLILATFVMCAPLVLMFLGAANPGGLDVRGGIGLPSLSGIEANLDQFRELSSNGASAPPLWRMVAVSLAIGLGVAALTTGASFLAAFAIVFFAGPAVRWTFWISLATLYFPIEARMIPTFEVAAALGLLNSYPGLILPILPLALGTLVFRQHLKILPGEIMEAARLDGAGPLRILRDMVLPLSRVPMGAVFLITFMTGWNQYLWPLMISVDNGLFPLMRGLNLAGTGSGPGMVIAAISVLPPLALVLIFGRALTRLTAIRV